VAGGPCRTYLDTGTDLKACSRRPTTFSLADELLGDLGLALQDLTRLRLVRTSSVDP
jgi:hypothetical protein